MVNPIENDTCEKSNTDETGFTEMRRHPSKQNLYFGNLDTSTTAEDLLLLPLDEEFLLF